MISDPKLLRYACVAHVGAGVSATILAEYNLGESLMQALAKECLIRTPANHALFNHTVYRSSYTFLIDDQFVYFAISDWRLPKSDRIWLLSRVQAVAHLLIAVHSKFVLKSNESFSPYCLQSQIHPIFHRLVSDRGGDGVPSFAKEVGGPLRCKAQSRERRNSVPPLLVKAGEGLKKKKRLFGESGGEMLAEEKVEMLDQSEVAAVAETTTRGLSSGDAFVRGKQKPKKVWKWYVWVVIVLDLSLLLIFFRIWLKS